MQQLSFQLMLYPWQNPTNHFQFLLVAMTKPHQTPWIRSSQCCTGWKLMPLVDSDMNPGKPWPLRLMVPQHTDSWPIEDAAFWIVVAHILHLKVNCTCQLRLWSWSWRVCPSRCYLLLCWLLLNCLVPYKDQYGAQRAGPCAIRLTDGHDGPPVARWNGISARHWQ